MTSVGVKSFKSLPGTLPLLSSVTLLAMACSTTVLAHSGHIHNEAFEACETKTKGEACSYLVANTLRYKGSCQVFNLKTLCVRSEPIEYLRTVPDEIEIEVKTDQVTTHQITIDQLGTVKTSNVNAANIPSQ